MSIVEVLRHSYKDGKRLSEEGRVAAFKKGQELRQKYPDVEMDFFGTDYQAEPGYVGRVADSAECENIGAGNHSKSSTIDYRLKPEYDSKDYDAAVGMLKEDPTRSEIKVIFAFAKYSVLSNARRLAEFIDDKSLNDRVDVPSTNSPTPQALAYLLCGLDESVLVDCDPLNGITAEYNEANDEYTITLNYLDGREIKVKGTLQDKCDEMIRKARSQDKEAELEEVRNMLREEEARESGEEGTADERSTDEGSTDEGGSSE